MGAETLTEVLAAALLETMPTQFPSEHSAGRAAERIRPHVGAWLGETKSRKELLDDASWWRNECIKTQQVLEQAVEIMRFCRTNDPERRRERDQFLAKHWPHTMGKLA